MFSLYFFLRRFDSTLIVSLSIPFSIIAACGLMYFMGKTLNVLSMMGLMLGGRHAGGQRRRGPGVDRPDPPDRAGPEEGGPDRSRRRWRWLSSASTLTTLIVFLPLIVGAKVELTTWLGEIGIAIAIALACSLFSSLTLIPLMSAHFLGRKKPKPIKSVTWLEDRYVSLLGWTLHHKVKTFGLLLLVLGIGLVPFFTGMVESAIFSGAVNKRLFLQYEFADFTYKSEAERVVDQVEEVLDEHREEFRIDSIYSFFAENRAETSLVLTRQDLDDDAIKELRQKVREALPEIAGVKLYFDDDARRGRQLDLFCGQVLRSGHGRARELRHRGGEAYRDARRRAGHSDLVSRLASVRSRSRSIARRPSVSG